MKEQKWIHVIDIPPAGPLPEGATVEERAAHTKDENDATDVACLMLATMSAELQKQHEHMDAYEMIEHLQRMFEGHARQERYDTSKALYDCKQGEREPVQPHESTSVMAFCWS